jgi:hypothetical protein
MAVQQKIGSNRGDKMTEIVKQCSKLLSEVAFYLREWSPESDKESALKEKLFDIFLKYNYEVIR